MKLTKAQMQFLRELGTGDRNVSDSWNPARKLVDLGLAVGRTGKWGSFIVSITPSGRAALENAE